MSDVVRILRGTIARLREVGWRDSNEQFLENGKIVGPLCLVNTVFEVERDVISHSHACLALRETLKRDGVGGYISLGRWNDAQLSVEPVIDLCERTIARLESKSCATRPRSTSSRSWS